MIYLVILCIFMEGKIEPEIYEGHKILKNNTNYYYFMNIHELYWILIGQHLIIYYEKYVVLESKASPTLLLKTTNHY